MGDAGRCDGRALARVLAIALCLATVVAWPADANIGGVFPTDEEGGTAIEAIASNQNLFAYALTDVQGGDICIVPAALENPGTGKLNCLTPAWGSSNRVIGDRQLLDADRDAVPAGRALEAAGRRRLRRRAWTCSPTTSG